MNTTAREYSRSLAKAFGSRPLAPCQGKSHRPFGQKKLIQNRRWRLLPRHPNRTGFDAASS
jgi:hypothetical protein